MMPPDAGLHLILDEFPVRYANDDSILFYGSF